MPKYLVKYSIGKNNEYLYPKSVEGVVWKSTVFHFTDHDMIGETDDKILADGKEVILLKAKDAKKLEKKYRSTRPRPEESPDRIMYLE